MRAKEWRGITSKIRCLKLIQNKKVDQLEAEKTDIFPIWESPTAMFPVCFSTSPSQTVAECQVVAATRDMEKRLGSLRQALVFWRTSVCQKRGCDGWLGVERIPCQRYSQMLLVRQLGR